MSEDDDVILTREDKMAIWQMCRVVLDIKRKYLTKDEGLEQFAYWAELPPSVAILLLNPMLMEKMDYLRKAFPDWIDPDFVPEIPDARTATKAKNAARRKSSGVDAVDRPMKNKYQTG